MTRNRTNGEVSGIVATDHGCEEAAQTPEEAEAKLRDAGNLTDLSMNDARAIQRLLNDIDAVEEPGMTAKIGEGGGVLVRPGMLVNAAEAEGDYHDGIVVSVTEDGCFVRSLEETWNEKYATGIRKGEVFGAAWCSVDVKPAGPDYGPGEAELSPDDERTMDRTLAALEAGPVEDRPSDEADPFYRAAQAALEAAQLASEGGNELYPMLQDGDDAQAWDDPMDQCFRVRELLLKYSEQLTFYRSLKTTKST